MKVSECSASSVFLLLLLSRPGEVERNCNLFSKLLLFLLSPMWSSPCLLNHCTFPSLSFALWPSTHTSRFCFVLFPCLMNSVSSRPARNQLKPITQEISPQPAGTNPDLISITLTSPAEMEAVICPKSPLLHNCPGQAPLSTGHTCSHKLLCYLENRVNTPHCYALSNLDGYHVTSPCAVPGFQVAPICS